jgi:hypothetical protein
MEGFIFVRWLGLGGRGLGREVLAGGGCGSGLRRAHGYK